jgi:hypothetical protein
LEYVKKSDGIRKMKLKKEYIILALIIIGISVYLYMRKTDRTLYQIPDIPKVAKKDLTKLRIKKDDTSIVLNKKDNSWFIEPENYPADADKVGYMLDTIEDLTLTALVSESKNYNRYELNDETKINVQAWNNDDLKRNFDVGKTAASFRHTFVKLADDERVFHAEGNFRSKFDTTTDMLRDKRVLAFKPEEILEFQIAKDQQTVSFIKAQVSAGDESTETGQSQPSASADLSDKWQTADGRSCNENIVKQLLNTLSNLRCEKYIDDRKKEDFTSALFTLQLKGLQEYNLSVFPKINQSDSDYPAISSGNDYAFFLSDSQANRIMKDPSEILKKQLKDEATSESEAPETPSQKQ